MISKDRPSLLVRPAKKPPIKPRSDNRRVLASFLVASAMGLATIIGWEGVETNAYQDVVGIATIGVGSTYYPSGTTFRRGNTTLIAKGGERVLMGDVISVNEAKRAMAHAVDNTYSAYVRACVNVPLSQNEFDAYTSLAYNIGGDAFCKSTLVRLVNMKQYAAACAQILRWNRSGGKVVRGLVNRRQGEFKMCIGDEND